MILEEQLELLVVHIIEDLPTSVYCLLVVVCPQLPWDLVLLVSCSKLEEEELEKSLLRVEDFQFFFRESLLQLKLEVTREGCDL
jgi:hypothetical protein